MAAEDVQARTAAQPKPTLKSAQLRGVRRRLRASLIFFLVLLALPFFAVVYVVQAKLKQESFYLIKQQAEDLARHVAEEVSAAMTKEELRQFSDYQFLSVGKSLLAEKKAVALSPLASPKPPDSPAGIIGYFQLDGGNRFSSPLLPSEPTGGAQLAALGIDGQDLLERRRLVQQLQQILKRNSLFPSIPAGKTASFAEPKPERGAADTAEDLRSDSFSAVREGRSAEPAIADSARAPAAAAKSQTAAEDSFVANFDALRMRQDKAAAGSGAVQSKVNRKLWLRGAQQQEETKLAETAPSYGDSSGTQALRSKRKAQIYLPETQSLSQVVTTPLPQDDRETAGSRAAADGEQISIAVFEGEIDPMQCVLIESSIFLCYRKVWQGGSRYIQGFMLDSAEFLGKTTAEYFYQHGIADVGSLVVNYRSQFFKRYQGRKLEADIGLSSRATQAAPEEEQILLYESAYPAPLDDLSVQFLVGSLAPGPGADAISAAVAGFIAVLFLGLWAIYRQGLAQIELAEQRNNFVSAVSHELKTPLTSIRMYAEMLREGWVADPQKAKSYYDFIFFESERLSRLISNVLHLAKIGRGSVPAELKPVAADKLLQLVEGKIGSQVQAAGFTLQVDFVEEQDRIMVDEDLFTQIFINLADNAVKFSAKSDEKRICLGLRVVGEGSARRADFFIRDFGPGIAPGRMKKIFELFYRGEDELTRAAPGTGIGLALVHQLAHQMSARVDVRNREPGAEFIVSFPFAAST